MNKILKYLLSSILFLSLSSAAYAVEEDGTKSVLELSAEARVSSEPVDISNAKKFSTTDNDFVGNAINEFFPKQIRQPWVKWIVEAVDYHPDEHTYKHSVIESVLDLLRLRALMLIALIGLIVWSIRLVWVASAPTSKDNQEHKAAIKKVFVTVTVMLTVGLVFQPDILLGLLVIAAFLGNSTLNYAYRFLDSDAISGFTSSLSTKEIEVQSKLDFYADDESNMLINATVERITKHALINAKGSKFARNWIGFANDSVTKSVVFSNIENNIVVEAKPVIKDGEVKTINYYWKGDFEGFDENKYGPANLLFSTNADGLGVSTSFQQLDSDIAKRVKTKATNDGAKVISASENQSIASKYEEMVYGRLSNNEDYYDIVRYADAELIQRVGNALQAGKKELADELKFEALTGDQLKSYLDLYGKVFSNSVQGYNFEVTQLGKYRYARSKLDIHKYNCSTNYEMREPGIKSIAMLNLLQDTWINTEKVAYEVDWQCTVIQGGVAVTLANDPAKADVLNELKLRSTASGIALNLLKSNVIAGVEYGDKKFNSRNNPMTNMIVRNWDKGWISPGFNTIIFGKLLSSNNVAVNAIRNSTNVSVSLLNNDIGVDFEKLFGDKKTDKTFAPMEVLVSYQPFIFEPLLNPAKAQAIQSYQDAQNLNDEEASTGDYLINLIQSSSSILTNAKARMGLPPDMPMNKGYQYCNSSVAATKECNLRGNGTVATALYGSEILTLGLGLKTFVVAVKMWNSSDIGALLDKTGFSDSKIMKLLGKVGGGILSLVGKVLSVVMAGLNIILTPIDVLANILILFGFICIVIQYVPMIIIIMAAISFVINIVRVFILVIPLLVKVVLYSEPRHLITAFKVSVVEFVGVFFLLIGHYVMIHCINVWTMTSMERELYGIVAPDGGIFSTMLYILVAIFVYLCIHGFFVTIPILFKNTSKDVTGEQASIIESANVGDSMKKMLVLYAVEKALIDNGIKKVDNMLDEKAKIKRAEEKQREESSSGHSKNVDVEGKK